MSGGRAAALAFGILQLTLVGSEIASGERGVGILGQAAAAWLFTFMGLWE